MSDDPQTNLRYFALMMRSPQHGWVIIPFVQALLDRSIRPEGQLYGIKDGFATKDYATSLANLYFDSLRPRGGSWAGAVRGQNNEPDPTGESDMNAIVAIMKTDLSEKSKENVDNAARVLLVLVKDLVANQSYGLRSTTGLCELVDVDGASNAYSLLDDCMSQLDPLEALLYGPGDLITLQTEGVTNHDIRFRASDLRRFERRLLASFRTSTTDRQLSSTILLERRSVIRTLQYMQSRQFLANTRGQPGAPTPSGQQVTRDFFHRICCERGAGVPKEAEAIEAAMQTELSGIPTGRVICERVERGARGVANMAVAPTAGGLQRAPRAAPYSLGSGPRGNPNAGRGGRGDGRPRAHAARPGSSGPAPQGPRTACPNCGEFGHWARECPQRTTRAPAGRTPPGRAPARRAPAPARM